MNPTYDEILKANSLRGNVIRKTPLIHSPTFSNLTNSEIYLKEEFRQKTGSFKIRGAYYKIKSLTDEEKKHGVVAASAGNHAQGVALASSLENISCTIVMPKNASPAKVAATRGYGANVILEGINYDESYCKAKEIAKQTGATIVQAFDDPQIIAAQGVNRIRNIRGFARCRRNLFANWWWRFSSWYSNCNKRKKSKYQSNRCSIKIISINV